MNNSTILTVDVMRFCSLRKPCPSSGNRMLLVPDEGDPVPVR